MRPRQAKQATLAFAIVASRYNSAHIEPLTEHARAEINALEPGATVDVIHAPGSFEIPILAQAAAETKRYQAILALGLLFQGETAHAMLVAQAVTSALLDISLRHRIPVIHEVLLVNTPEQARARCSGLELNRGIEAARAAVAAARTLREIK